MAVSKPRGEHVDVLIVGAGISGIDAAYRLQTRCPRKTYAILEARARIGGTWDLFRYPGVRSDSDIFTLGFPFRPWRSDQAIVGGDAIRDYVEDTAREFGIFEKIRFSHRVTRASWSSDEACWTVETSHGAFTCRFLYLASGYYDYERAYRPTWPGESDFRGTIVHPQFWPEDLDHAGKRVAVIGSGATAVTLVPALAESAAHVVMVQRTPTYIFSRPARDPIAGWLQRWLPARTAAAITRWTNILITISLYRRARRKPDRVAAWFRDHITKELPAGYPVERDFSPPYKPWDQRLCLVPDGDLFAAMRSGSVSIQTGAIERFTPDGLRMQTGQEVAADVIVTATGLNVRLLGGSAIEVDGRSIKPADLIVWKGMMLSGVPNLFLAFGYTNASWTLRSDLTARSMCRLLNAMNAKRQKVCIARPPAHLKRRSILELSSGYVERAAGTLPGQGDRQPWRVPQHYLRDAAAMMLRPIDEGLEFGPSAS
jgi:monooxygenase